MKLTILSLIGLCLVLSPTLAGAWTYEQVEPAGNWSWVELDAMPTGTICVCYQDSMTGHVFISRKDSTSHRDDIGVWPLPSPDGYPPTGPGRHLVLGPEGKPAVLLESDTVLVYAVLAETGWSYATVRCTTGYSFLAFDSSGSPSLIYYYYADGPYADYNLSSACERDGVWSFDTLEVGYYDGFFWHGPTPPTTFVLGPGNRFYDDRGHFVGFTMGSSSVYVDTGRTRAWGGVFGSSGRYASGVSMSPGPSSDFAVCYNVYDNGRGSFRCNYEVVETLQAWPGRVRVDSRDLPQIVYRLGVMKYAYRTSVWHIDTLPPEINAAQSFDFAVDHNDMPLIAFSNANGIFLATGDMVGVAEKIPQVVCEPPRLPTVVRGVLSLPLAAGRLPLNALIDISGRKVLDLRAGPNDVSRIAPGVYFIFEQAEADAQRSAINRVVLVR